MPCITVIDHTSAPADARRHASLTGILATMGGLAVATDLLGLDNIVNPGEWLQPVIVSCTRDEADALAAIVNDSLAEKGSRDAGRIVFMSDSP